MSRAPERCDLCQCPIKQGERVDAMRDEEGDDWIVHEVCAEQAMEIVFPHSPPSEKP